MTQIAILMDDITSIKPHKDSTFAMILEAQRRHYDIQYFTHKSMYCNNGTTFATTQAIKVHDSNNNWYHLGDHQLINLAQCDMVFMRKDPPFDMEYIMDTYALDLVESAGTPVINSPQALRNANEKFFTEHFHDITPKSVISRNPDTLKDAAYEWEDIIVKPMDGMGGNSIFKTGKKDKNLNVILETVTQNGTRTTMVQQFIPEIKQGDKRILLINGTPVPYALARIPSQSDFRGNLAKGGTGKGVKLTARDYDICEKVGERLKKMGVFFAGIDVIGNYLTEINITSPTCIRELDALYKLNIAADLFNNIEKEIL